MRITLPHPKRFSKIFKSVTDYQLDKLVSGICTDSRQCLEGDLYLALQGERVDGHEFIIDAQNSGATAALITKELDSKHSLQTLQVDNVLQIIGKVANMWRKQFDVPVIGITGSNGKTTTKELTKHFLQAMFNVHYTKGNFNTAIGLPLTLLLLNDTHQICVLEMGANQIGDIHYLCQIAEPTDGLITNIGPAHLEGFGSIENVLKEKIKLFSYLSEGRVFKNISDEYLRNVQTSSNTVEFGCEVKCDYCADYYREQDGNIILTVNTVELNLNSQNLVFAKNVLAAVTVANSFGIGWDIIQSKLKEFTPTYGRSVITEYDDITVIDDTYNANYTSTIAALENLNQLVTKSRKIFVFGDMAELGDYSKEYHEKVGVKCAEFDIDAVFTIGEETINTYKSINGIPYNMHFENHAELVMELSTFIKSGDIILFKGSRSMEIEKIIQEVF